jgi:hypothetical protein
MLFIVSQFFLLQAYLNLSKFTFGQAVLITFNSTLLHFPSFDSVLFRHSFSYLLRLPFKQARNPLHIFQVVPEDVARNRKTVMSIREKQQTDKLSHIKETHT